jgi:hypothetical protein
MLADALDRVRQDGQRLAPTASPRIEQPLEEGRPADATSEKAQAEKMAKLAVAEKGLARDLLDPGRCGEPLDIRAAEMPASRVAALA